MINSFRRKYIYFVVWFIHISDLFHIGRWKEFRKEKDSGLRELSAKLPEVILKSKAENTVKKYNYAFRSWCSWCKIHDSINCMPATDYHVSLYIIYLMQSNCSTSKIEEVLYSIAWAHSIAGYDNPCASNLVLNVAEGAKRQLSRPCSKKEPITPDILKKLVEQFGSNNSLYDKRIVTMCLIAYAGFLRFSELVNIRACDILFYPTHVSIFIEKSKTDKYRQGTYVIIAKTDRITCPVAFLSSYIKDANINLEDDKYIFRQISFYKSSNSYKLRNAGHISYTRARELLLEKLESLGLETSKFGLHSLRSGGATSAANAGISDRIFKKHGRWKSDRAKDGYVKEDLKTQLSVSQNLGI